MGDVTVFGFGALAILGGALVAVGALRRSRAVALPGAAVLVPLTGAWLFGPIGLGLGAPILIRLSWARARLP